jgi:hypothetical protein
MEVSALSALTRPIAATNEPDPPEVRKTEQREASVEGTRVQLADRDERLKASQTRQPAILYQTLGRAHASSSASVSDEAIDLFSTHSTTDFDARNQLAAGSVLDTSTVRDPPSTKPTE